jgi:hypothetical protein
VFVVNADSKGVKPNLGVNAHSKGFNSKRPDDVRKNARKAGNDVGLPERIVA